MTEDQARQRVIRAMCPEKVCRTCGEPSRRMTEHETYLVDGPPNNRRIRGLKELSVPRSGKSKAGMVDSSGLNPGGQGYQRVVIGESWSDCGHDDWRPGRVLDPFRNESGEVMLTLGNIDQK